MNHLIPILFTVVFGSVLWFLVVAIFSGVADDLFERRPPSKRLHKPKNKP